MKRVLVLWADRRSANYGVRVVAEGSAALARSAWGDDTVVDFQDYGTGDSGVSFGAKSILRDIGRRNGPIRAKLRDYDLVIDSGAGDSFADIYGMKRLLTMAYGQRVAFSERIPVAMGPQTVGPFDTRRGRMIARHSLKKMTVVLARDSTSDEYARTLGRVPNARVTDVVFALPRPSVERSRDVVLNVSGLLWFSDKHVGAEKYQTRVRALIAALTSQGRKVTLLAHVMNQVSTVDDRAAIREILAADSSGLSAEFPATLWEAREIVGSARVVIGSRMHACLNALSMGTPSIPWAYSRKFAPLLADIGWGHAVDLRTDDEIVAHTLDEIAFLDSGDASAELSAVIETADDRLARAVQVLREEIP